VTEKPKILFAFSQRVRDTYLIEETLGRLEKLATWDWFACEGGGIYDNSNNVEDAAALRERLADADGLVLCHGSPMVDASVLEGAKQLRIIGELEGDRFASRIDIDAAWERDIRVVDTTNGSSYPVSEWALAMILVACRNGGTQFLRMRAGEKRVRDPFPFAGTLVGKRVGLIGCGHMGRRLMKYLRPFDVDIYVHDPYLPRELPEALDFTLTSLDNIFTTCDVVVCVAPLTPGTKGMIGEREINLLQPNSVFVNVSRGAVVDSDALIARIKKGDISVGLEVFDPEPVPPDHEILTLPNVFQSPHSSSGGVSRGAFFELMVDELERFFAGHETWFDITPNTVANRKGT
jgi:phosphoglycerate dehydrogenase-like enzyme